MNFSPVEMHMIRSGLREKAAAYRREAASRKWYGTRWESIRADYRDKAERYAELAKRV